MMLDNQLVLCDAQAFTVDAISTNIIDLSKTARSIGAGNPMCIAIHVDVAADFTTMDETYAFEIRTDDDVAFGSPTTLQARTIAPAALTAGSTHVMVLDPTWEFERYLALYFDGGGTTPIITITAHLIPLNQIQTWKPYDAAGDIT